MRRLFLALSLVAALASADAAPTAALKSPVVRPAPDFAIPGIGKMKSLKSLRGQPVVLVIARSPKEKAFRAQAKYLQEIYQQFASKQVIFVAAFTEESGEIIKSDIPFVVVNNGAAVAGAYSVVEKFAIAIIGKDGNLDYQTTKVLPPERVRDVIQNSYAVQANTGR